MIKNKPNHLYKLGELLLIIFYWILASRIIVFMEYFSLNPSETYFGEPKVYSVLRDSLFTSGIAGFAIGLLTGLSELYIFQRYFRNKAFFKLFLSKIILYLACIFFISFFTLLYYYHSIKEQSLIASLDSTVNAFTAQSFYHLMLLGLLFSLGINFLLLMKNKIGHTNFFPILLGKYHRPKEENRVFLFIDLISSVQMAEQLGHIKYSQLLQDCFADLSKLVISFRGSIYQFVGDEAVITWRARRKSSVSNSISLFFAFQDYLSGRSDFYEKKYGVVPVFKGSINSGKVMVAEVGGNIKSEIAYHGDVLNTAARMIELCKVHDRKLMVSENIVNQFNKDESSLEFELHGDFQLRGKDEKMKVYSARS